MTLSFYSNAMLFLLRSLVSKEKRFSLAIIFLLYSLGVYAQPILTSFAPSSGPIGTQVTITGSGFNPSPAANIVLFGAVRASITAATTTSITAIVPSGATYELLSITVNNLTAYSKKPFAVTFLGGNDILFTSFEGQVEVETDLFPNASVIMDFDGDGRPDVATPNNHSRAGAASVSILRNISTTGKLSLAPRKDMPTGAVTFAMAAGDLNGDGKPELVSVSVADKTLSVFRNNSTLGNISFTPKTDYPTGASPFAIAIGDFDADGKPDLAIANYASNSVSIYRNTSSSSISFASRMDITTGLAPHSIAARDLDGDGKPDIVVANELSNSVSIFKNASQPGNLSFASKTDFATGPSPLYAAIGDIDNDGRDDIAVSNIASATFSILRNVSVSGTIDFSVKKDFNTKPNGFSLSLGDLNGDGKADIIIPAETLSLYQNTSSAGTISFSSAVSGSVSPQSYIMAIGDLDGDGKPDLAGQDFTGRKVILLRNRINEPSIQSFTPKVAATGAEIKITGLNLATTSAVMIGGASAASFTVLNDNELTAIVGAAAAGDITVTTAFGTTSLSGFVFPAPPIIESFIPSTGTVGDVITITGKNLIGATGVKFGGIATTSFKVISPTVLKATVHAGATGNISVTNAYGTASISNFTFVPPPKITGFAPRSGPIGTIVNISGENFRPSVADNIIYFGAVKATVLSATSSNISVRVPAGITHESIRLISGKSGYMTETYAPFAVTFTSSTLAFNSFSASAIDVNFVSPGAFPSNANFVIGDLDGDGKPDIASAGRYNFQTGVSIVRNKSMSDSASFAKGVFFTSACELLAIGDIDGDGKLDLLTADLGATVNVLKNKSVGDSLSFDISDITNAVNGIRALRDIELGDMDGDGKLDILLLKSGGMVGVLRNTSFDGIITFAPEEDASNSTGTGQKIYVADLNNDNKPDIIISNDDNDTRVSVIQNKSSIGHLKFEGRQSYDAGVYPESIAIGDLNGDQKPDLVVAARGFNSIYLFKNTSNTTSLSFVRQPEPFESQGPGDVAISDVDGDSKPDIISIACCGIETLAIYKNLSGNGNFTFDSPLHFKPPAGSSATISTGDFNLDGRPDLIVMKEFGVWVYLNLTGTTIVTTLCANDSISLMSPIEGNIYQWQQNAGNGFVNLSDGPEFSGANTGQLLIKKAALNWNGHFFRCLIDNTKTSREFSLVVKPATNVPLVVIAASENPICKGSAVLFKAIATNGGSFPSYQWQINNVNTGSDADSLLASNFNDKDQVKVILKSSASCISTSTVTSNAVVLTVNAVPTKPSITQTGTVLSSSASNGNQWYLNGNPISGATSNNIVTTIAGQYTVRVTLNSCVSPLSDIFMFIATAIQSPILNRQIKVAPNPVEDKFTVVYNGSSATLELELYDLTGKRVLRKRFISTCEIAANYLAAGTYIVHIKNIRTREEIRRTIIKL